MSALTDLFTQIADAIRTKGGTSEQIAAANFPTAISNISGAIHGTIEITREPKTITIPGAAGKNNLLLFLSPISGASKAINYHTYGITVLNGEASNVKVSGSSAYYDATATWDSTTGAITVATSMSNGPWNWVAW